MTPFGIGVDDDEIADAFAEEDKSDFGEKIQFGGVFFDKDEVADDGDEDIKKSVEDGF